MVLTTYDMPHLPFDHKLYLQYSIAGSCHCQDSVFQFFAKYNSYSIPLTILPVIVKFVSGADLSCLTSLPLCPCTHTTCSLFFHINCAISLLVPVILLVLRVAILNFLILLPLSRNNFFSRPRSPDCSPCPCFAELGCSPTWSVEIIPIPKKPTGDITGQTPTPIALTPVLSNVL